MALFLPYLQQGRGVSIEGCRLKADDPIVIGVRNKTFSNTAGAIDLATIAPSGLPSARKVRDDRQAAAISAQKRAAKRATRHRNRSVGGDK